MDEYRTFARVLRFQCAFSPLSRQLLLPASPHGLPRRALGFLAHSETPLTHPHPHFRPLLLDQSVHSPHVRRHCCSCGCRCGCGHDPVQRATAAAGGAVRHADHDRVRSRQAHRARSPTVRPLCCSPSFSSSPCFPCLPRVAHLLSLALARTLYSHRLRTTVCAMDAFDIAQLPQTRLVVFVCSTTGQGEVG